MRLCCPKCCEGYSDELDHCPRCGPTWSRAERAAPIAERDRLAAENAELRKQSDEDMEAFLDMSRIADSYSMQLAAANATLDRLREVRNGCVEPKCSSQDDYADLVKRLESILYPENET